MKGKLKYLLLVVLTCGLIASTTAQAATTTSVGISKTKVTIAVGGSVKLKVTGTKKTVKWSTSNRKVATVNASGKVVGKKTGQATITASVSGKKLKCRVTVKKRKVALSRTSASVYQDKTITLKVNGTKKKATWSTSNEDVATVSSKGVVTGEKAGTAIITAKVGGKTLKCKVKVKNVLDVAKTKITVNGTGRVKVTLHEYATVLCNVMDASRADCSWGKWTGWTKDGTSNYLTIKGKKEGTVKIILTNSYNTEQHEIDVTVKKAAKS